MTEPRLASQIRVNALMRRTQAMGGFFAVLHKGDPVSGSILVTRLKSPEDSVLLSPMPALDGGTEWLEIAKGQDNVATANALQAAIDRDIWIIELDIADDEQFIALLSTL
jgi:hypothetical protein